jgi:membrane protein DedA with SNARE-associated domain
MTDDLIGQFGYLGIVLLLVLGGLGVPIPEEAPIVLSAILSHKGAMVWYLALAACFVGVLLGDFVVYFLGYFYGEKVLSFRLTRSFLTKAREEQIKGYFHRHGIKILIVGRFAVGFRTAAYLTAGILRLPPLRLLAADCVAATLSTLLMFGAGYWFADWIEAGLREAKHVVVWLVALALVGVVLYQYYKARKRKGRVVGPPILVEPDALPLPPDDLVTRGVPVLPPPPKIDPAPEPAAPAPPEPAPIPRAEPEPEPAAAPSAAPPA